MPLQIRRGLEADRTSITPAAGEPLFTTDTKNLYIGDGTTAGGVLVASDLDLVAQIVNDPDLNGYPQPEGLSVGPSVWWGVEATVSTTSPAWIDSVDITKYTSVRYQVQVSKGTDRHVSELRIFHDGTEVFLTEYGAMHNNGPLATFSADITSGNLRLMATLPTGGSTSFKLTAQGIKA